MNRAEIAKVLGSIRAYDNRAAATAGDLDSWLGVIGDLDFRQVMYAVEVYHRAATRWIMPADIRQLVEAAAIKPQRRAPCGQDSCDCTHAMDTATGWECSGGWLNPPPGADRQDGSPNDFVRPCPTCRPARARIVLEHGDGLRRGALLRASRER